MGFRTQSMAAIHDPKKIQVIHERRNSIDVNENQELLIKAKANLNKKSSSSSGGNASSGPASLNLSEDLDVIPSYNR